MEINANNFSSLYRHVAKQEDVLDIGLLFLKIRKARVLAKRANAEHSYSNLTKAEKKTRQYLKNLLGLPRNASEEEVVIKLKRVFDEN